MTSVQPVIGEHLNHWAFRNRNISAYQKQVFWCEGMPSFWWDSW